MKLSYNVVKRYIPEIKSPEQIADDLILHTAEVEEIIYEAQNLEKVMVGKVLSCKKHPDSEKLNCTVVQVGEKSFPIVCGAPNVKAGIKVPVALVGAQLGKDFTIAKTKIRGEVSEGMICSEDELGLIDERQEGILELPDNAKEGISMREYLGKNDIILEIDNKAINHRPDLFSMIGLIREIAAIEGKKLDFQYARRDFSSLPSLTLMNEIPKEVQRYMGLRVENVENKESPEYVKEVLRANEIESKGFLIDITNYSLYLYGQPTHIFDADKISGNIHIRNAKKGEVFIALNDCKYELSEEDIVIADEEKILALGGIIGAKDSGVSDDTKNIIVESAHFDQAVLRKTGKRLGIRTDALNVFEKDLTTTMQEKALALIVEEIEKFFPSAKVISFGDSYEKKEERVEIEYDLDFINRLIGREYSETEVATILENLGIEKENATLRIPFWRKDLHYKADIAEEIARIEGYNKVTATIPNINFGAVEQAPLYHVKQDIRQFLSNIGFFDMYTYSFVSKNLQNTANSSTKSLVAMKNPLSEEMTHLRGSLIPNLLQAITENSKSYESLKLFEVGKIFHSQNEEIEEKYVLGAVQTSDSENSFYELQNILGKLFAFLKIQKYSYEPSKEILPFSHSGRSADIIVHGKKVGNIGEIKPSVRHNFEIEKRVAYIEVSLELIENAVYGKIKAKDISSFQENNFDLSFLLDKDKKASDLKACIERTDKNLIQKVKLLGIYENEEKIPGKRSISYKVFIQSQEGTLDDKIKAELINKIIASVEKIGGTLR